MPRKRTYFEALGLEQRMRQERAAVEKGFREAARDVHPDRFGGASAVERRLALEHTTWINDAHRALLDPQRRAEYLLRLEGVEIGGEEERVEDPELLMTMMELQEKAAMSEDEAELEELLDEAETRRRSLLANVQAYFDEGVGTRDAAKSALDELRFVGRLSERIEERLEEL